MKLTVLYREYLFQAESSVIPQGATQLPGSVGELGVP